MVKEIRISDPYVVGLVNAEAEAKQDKCASRVAGRLIIERATQLGITAASVKRTSQPRRQKATA